MTQRNLMATGARTGAILGLALGLIYAVGGLVLDWTTTGLNAGTALAFLALIGMPLMFGALGGLAGLVLVGFRARSETPRNGH